VYFQMPEEPIWFAGPLVLAGTILASVLLRRSGGAPFLIAMVLAFVALGFAAASLRTHSLDGRLLTQETPTTVIEGRIVEFEPYHQGSRVILDRVRVAALSQPATPERVRVRLRGHQPALKAGDWVRLRGRLSAPSPPLMPGGFDFQRHAYFTGIGAVGFSMGAARVLEGPPPGPFDWRVHLSNLRVRLAMRVTDAVPGDAGAVAAALITGYRSLIPETVLNAFRDAGLAHLLAISGLHIGLAAGIVFFGARRALSLYPPFAQRFPVKKAAALLALLAAFGYALMAGATVPTQRAFLIAAMVLIAVMVDRRGISLRMLAWGATVVLLIQPESLLGPSFQMSFAAAIALVAAYEAATERGIWRRDGDRSGWAGRGIALYVAGVSFTTLVASLATAPFVLYHFNQVAKFGLLANLVAVPITALWVMPAAMLSFLLLPFGWEKLALIPMGWGTEQVIRAADWVAGLPEATEILPSAPAWALTGLALGGLWLCVLRGRLRLAGLAGVALFAAANARVVPPDLIVSAAGDLAAVRGQEGYLFSSLRHGRFTRENWLEHAGYRTEEAVQWARDGGYGRLQRDGLRCDGVGCVLTRAGWRVVLAETRGALAEDCGRADLVIALIPAGGACDGTGGTGVRVIDLFDLRAKGAHSITLGPAIEVQAVNDGRGRRPWVVRQVRKR
ncbi:MAG TPA: metal-binding protein, partial [Rhodospirillaceae bacterium]|nr:metal-binding protein [Rhodospirillaceae bacterium]